MKKPDEYFMELAIKEALIAEKMGEVPVGAVCVYDGEVLSKAHNRVIKEKDASAHAEICALREAAVKIGNYRLNDVSLYVTLEPCIMCTGAIIHFRIKKLVYGTKDERWGGVESLYRILSDPRLNHKVEIISGVKEEECRKIIKDFFEKKR